MIKLQVNISGVQGRADELIIKFRHGARLGLAEVYNQIYRKTETNLQGEVLKIRSGKLLASLNTTSFIESRANVLYAQIGANTPYAAYHEFGFTGTEQISTYSRGGHVVPAHTRNVNYPARSYLRPAFDAGTMNLGEVLAREINK